LLPILTGILSVHLLFEVIDNRDEADGSLAD
jgi:hypothetical protein